MTTLHVHPFKNLIQQAHPKHTYVGVKKVSVPTEKKKNSTWQSLAGGPSSGDKPREEDQRQRGGETAWTEVRKDR